MEISRENAGSRRNYRDAMHVEFSGGEFYGSQTFIYNGSKRGRRTEVLEWISTIPYTSHHRRISDDRLAGTAEWILKKEEYRTWKSLDVSKLLLLRGIPGAGKTYIASRVIDSHLSNPASESKLVYFYCNRAEESRREPERILCTLIQQLAQSPSQDELLKPVLDIYKDREKQGQLSSGLTLTECQDLLVQLTDIYPQTIICIDALDEIDHTKRLKLLHVLKYLVERSKNLVKIFATTRMDTDILLQFRTFPRIELQPDDNVADINQFVKATVQKAIEQKQLLHGNSPDELRDEICKVLCERSKGMFQLAALHITFLCDMATQDDVRHSLNALPDTLTDAYGEIYNRILRQKGSAPQLALNAFRWVQCSYEPLRSETLLDAITTQIDTSRHSCHRGAVVMTNDLLKACHNLLILDERLNVFRFAHLSVEEYLETKLDTANSHTEIAKVCLSFLCTSDFGDGYNKNLMTREGSYSDRHLLLYAAVFWPWHYVHCEDSCPILSGLWEAFVAEATFQRWIDYHCRCVQTKDSRDTFWLRSKALQQGKDILSTVCVFGLGRRFASIFESKYRWEVRMRLKFAARFKFRPERSAHIDWLLRFACRVGDLNIAQHLLDVGANGSAKETGTKETPLHVAVANGHEPLARLLVDRGSDVSATDRYGRTPLHRTAVSGHQPLARLLIDRGADVSAADQYGRTPLHRAAENRDKALARLLADRGADVSAADKYGRTPLHRAAENGDEALARMLADRGADVSAADKYGRTPLYRAAEKGDEALALLLVNRDADVSVVDSYGQTPLHHALENGHEALALLLIGRGADVSAADRDGWTPLHGVVRGGHEARALQLVGCGADVSAADRHGWTALHGAAENGHETLALLLVDRGADVSAADRDGWTPLHEAARNGHEALARLLVGHGADVSVADGRGRTPLHRAAAKGHEALARLLVDRGADVSAADAQGRTPLHRAVAKGHESLAQLLVAAAQSLQSAR